MPTMNHYNLPAFAKNFAVGDEVRVYVADERMATESWTRILEQVDADHFLVRSTVRFTRFEASLRAAGLVYDREDGVTVHKVHIDDLKPASRAREESALYHQEEYEAGCL